ncbi:YadA-like family protein [Achromobacter pestifer]|uniref:YadA-like family protein n=1 Tax=Achromobacter pestifer TaxID=1353889 RepID=UPI001FE38B9A|nr:YadA-like family protein [Achromobacter pestifer]
MFAYLPEARATTYGPENCNLGSAVGPDGITSVPGSAPADGSGLWSNVIGCSAKGGGYQGVQVLGFNATATGSGATVLGYASSGAARGTAVGMQARGSGMGSTAIGQWTRATGASSVAIGGNISSNTEAAGAQALGNDSVAISGQSRARGSESIAIGVRSEARRNGDVAIGSDSVADGTVNNLAAVAVGRGAIAVGEDALALGNSSNAQVNYGAAIGNFATVTARNATAIGNSAKSGGVAATAIGNFSNAAAANAVAIGGGGQPGSFAGAQATGVGAVALGGNNVRGAVSAAASGIALGGESNVEAGADSGIAIGRGAQVLDAADYGIAQGDGATARSQNDIAIGRNAATAADSDGNNIALGNGVATGDQGHNVAIGSGATTANASSATGGAVAIGRDQRAIGNGAVALGDPNTANGTGAVALGAENIAAGDETGDTASNGAVAIGNGNRAIGQGSIALGNGSTTSDAGSIALGDTASASAANAIAMGSGANAANAGDVALGAQSRTEAAVATASTTIDGQTYQFAGISPDSTVSVGDAGAERTITNVAAGRINANSTDAINGSQLFATNQAIETVSDSAVKYDQNPDGTVNYESVTLNPGGDPARLGNVAAGDVSATSTDAVNGSQLYETNQNVTQMGDTITNIAGDTSQANTDANGMGIRYVRTNEAGLAQSDASAQGQGSTAVGYNATATADSALAIGREAQASHAGSVALGANAVADGATLGSTAYNPGAGTVAGPSPVGEVSIGSAGAERRITNVAAGATDTDAVNVSQLKSLATDVGNLGDRAVQYDGNPGDPKDSITLAGPASTDGGATGGTRITNVAQGDVSANSTDAVNGSQLYETNQQVAENATNINQIGDTITNIAGDTSQANTDANGMGIRYVRTNEAGLAQSDASAQGQGSTAVGYNATATADSALAIGREAQASHAGSVALGANAVADGATLGSTAYNPGAGTVAGPSPVGEVSIGSAGAERRITNVAAGATDTDAVNVSQLKSLATDVGNLGDRAVQYDGNPGDPKDSITLAGPASTDGGATGGTRITNVAQGDVSANSTDAVNGSQLYETNQQVAENATNINQIGDTITNIAGDTSQANTDANGMGIRYVRTNEAGLAQSDASAQGQGSTAVGYNATATADSALAIGSEAQASHAGSVALGANAVADGATLGSAAYNPGTGTVAGLSPVGEVSIGSAGEERRITNVAAGATDTDAVNVSQLKSLATDVGNLGDRAVQYDGNPGDPKDSITLAGPASTDGGATGGTRITNVAQGDVSANSTDAVNGSQLYETNQNVTQMGDTITNIAGDTSQANTDANGMGIRYVRTNEAGLAQSDASAQGQGSTAVGYNATATADSALAIGRGAQATESGSVALGSGSVSGRALAPASGSIAAGSGGALVPFNTTDRTLQGAVSVGSNSTYRQITNVADGTEEHDAATVRQLTGAIESVTVTGTRYFHANSTEPDSLAAGAESIAIGPQTVVNSDSGVGIGDRAVVEQNAPGGIALGQQARTVMADGIAIGTQALANAEQGVAIGTSSSVSVGGGVALGAGSIANTAAGVAGYVPPGADSAGIDATRSKLAAVSIGDVAAGEYRQINGVAAGTVDTDAVNVSQLKAVVSNVSELAAGVVKYDTNPDGTVNYESVTLNPGGDPARLGNVAAGDVSATSTDAVNGSQLYETNQQVAENATNINQIGDTITYIAGDTSQANTDANGMGIRYVRTNEAGLAQSDASAQGQGSTAVGYNATATADSALAIGREAQASHAGSVALGANAVADGASLGSAAYNPGTGTVAGLSPVGEVSIGSAGAERRITNVAAGAIDTDAVNVSQLKAVDSKFQDLVDTDTGIKYFHANSLAADSRALGAESVAIGPRALANAEEAIALGNAAEATGTGAISLGSGSQVSGQRAASFGAGNNISGAGAFSLGNNNNVVAANAFVLGSGVSILDSSLSGAVVLGNGSSVTAASATRGATINGVEYAYAGGDPAAGDVLSVGSAAAPRQIQNVAAGRIAIDSTDAVNGSQLYATHQAIDSLGATVNSIANGGAGVKYFHANGGASAAMPDSQANGLGSVAAGPNAIASGANSVAMGNGAAANKDGDVALGAGSIADRGSESYTGKYSGAQNDTAGTVSVGAPGAERTVSNVADGRNATDAVNVRQLEGAVKEANDYTDKRITEVAGSVVEVGDKINKIDNRVTVVEGDVANIKNGADGMFQVSQDGTPPPAPTASGKNAVAGGAGAVASGKDSTAVGNGAQATGAGATAIGQGSNASGSNAVALGAGSEAARDNSVSVGAVGSERQIINVAPGTAGTDAANINQLREVESGLSTQVAGVRRDLQRLDSRLSAGIAGAMAMSGLPQAYLPGKSMFSMGGATWRGESGFAMGLSTVSDNGRWVVKGLANSTSRGDLGAAVGVGYQW